MVGEVHVPQQAGGLLQVHLHLQDPGDLPQRRQLGQQEPRRGPVGESLRAVEASP